MTTEKITTLLHYQGEINGPIIAELLDDLDFKCINNDVPDQKRKKYSILQWKCFKISTITPEI